MQRRLLALPGGLDCDPEQIELLAAGYTRDRAAHEEEAARDLLQPPPRPAKVRAVRRVDDSKPGPLPRGLPEPAELLAPLVGREARRYGRRTRAADLEDDVLANRLAYVALHKKRLSPQDLAAQREWTEARAVTYQLLTSDAAAAMGRDCPDFLKPLVGTRSRVRQAVIAVLCVALRLQKTGVALSRLEWAKVIFCGETRINDVLLDLEEEGWITTIARYRRAELDVGARHASNFYTAGPRLLEHAQAVLERSAAPARALQRDRRRHAARLRRGPHRPQPYLEPEEWVRAKAEAGAQALEEEARVRAEHRSARDQIAAHVPTLAARMAAGEPAGAVFAEHLAALDAARAVEQATVLILPPELLAEHDAAITLIGVTPLSGDPATTSQIQGLDRPFAAAEENEAPRCSVASDRPRRPAAPKASPHKHRRRRSRDRSRQGSTARAKAPPSAPPASSAKASSTTPATPAAGVPPASSASSASSVSTCPRGPC